MQLRSLSASSALVFEGCEARWKASYEQRAPDLSGSAAALGTVVHAALEWWVADGHYLADHTEVEAAKVMTELYDRAYVQEFADHDRYDEGLSMAQNWRKRQDWAGREVLSTEQKVHFRLPTPPHEVEDMHEVAEGQWVPTGETYMADDVEFRYIWDRCDRIDNGDGTYDIDIVDYKSVAQPIQPADIKKKIQGRAYALAGAIQFPEAKRIWVTMDLLRFEPVGTSFSRDENLATWDYLKALAARIIESDGTTETLNPECRWCIRRLKCDALNAHVDAGGPLGLDDPAAAAARLREIRHQVAGMKVLEADLQSYLLGYAESEELLEFEGAGGVPVRVTASSRRSIDGGQLAAVIGPELAAEMGTPKMGAVDALLKKPGVLTQDQKVAVKALIRKTYGEPSIKVDEAPV